MHVAFRSNPILFSVGANDVAPKEGINSPKYLFELRDGTAHDRANRKHLVGWQARIEGSGKESGDMGPPRLMQETTSPLQESLTCPFVLHPNEGRGK